MKGKIIKGIAGFYYCYVEGYGLYECKAKGIFRKDDIKPLVGDDVRIEVLDESQKKGNIVEICKRKNTLIRPNVANVDQALIIFAVAHPDPNFDLLDRFLIMMLQQGVETIICFNKKDLVDKETLDKYSLPYLKGNYKIIYTSTKTNEGLDELESLLSNKTTVLAGPSGVGKSSIINKLCPDADMEVGDISKKLKRGRHTTRHSEIFHVKHDTYIIDTPGFSSLEVRDIEKEDLQNYFPEFIEYNNQCRFVGCLHITEPDCAVKEALSEDKISNVRYESYKSLIDYIDSQKKYY
ncbi:MAG: ribosome small subunit-dependent GTPase A [Clostridiales bacterium]|nr:ribosome small subunit-dependent GTPase A [Clostridiales bacterium]